MANVIVKPKARLDIADIAEYIGRDNPDAAARFPVAARAGFEFLGQHPGSGRLRPDLAPLVRSWNIGGAFKKYLIFYRPAVGVADTIEIIRVRHGSINLTTLLATE